MSPITAEELVQRINGVFGSHAGYRALHAKGTLCKGTFTAGSEAAALTRAAHMQGEPVETTVRFSNGTGNPHHPDYAPDPRGLAVKFYLPDGSRTDIVSVTTPRFPVKTPDEFIELVEAQANQLTFPLYIAKHPGMIKGLPATLPTLAAPVSYASVPYYGVHAFKWIDARGGERYVRYEWTPWIPVERLKPWQARKQHRDYLQQEIATRLEAGPARFNLEVQIAEPGDSVDDPTAVWPKSRRRARVGTLEVTGLETERETGGDVLVFDPTRVTDGIELSADPILNFRHDAYGASVSRRMPDA